MRLESSARPHTVRLALALALAAASPLAAGEGAAQLAPGEQLYWVDRSGRVEGAVGEPQFLITSPIVSPDGGRVLVRAQDREGDRDDIWIHASAPPRKLRVTAHPADDKMPDWSPGGERVVFYSYRNGLADLYTRPADGTGEDTPLVATEGTHEYGPTWSPDGTTVAFHSHDPETDRRGLYYVTLGKTGAIHSFLPGEAGIAMPVFSPDGRFIAYVSDETGAWEVYVRAFPDGRESRRISTGGGMWPRWARGMDELFFFDGTDFMAVSFAGDPLRASAPRKLFSAASVGMAGGLVNAFNPLFDVSSDGQRLVVVRGPGKD